MPNPHPDPEDEDNTAKVPEKKEKSEQAAAEAKKELKQAIRGSHEIIAQATTVFPFTLFPDTVTVDRAKLTITKRQFFSIAEIVSIRIEDILNVTANVGPFFGSLHIVSRVLTNETMEIRYLWREDALKLKRILQGYVIAIQKKIDVTSLEISELSKLLDNLGLGDPDSNKAEE